VFNHKYAIK